MATSSDRQQENVGDNIQPDTDVEIQDEYWRYIPLVKAALEGNWDVARRFFDQDESALTAQITPSLETALHIAVGTGKALHFVRELVESMPVQALEVRDHKDDTALHTAAWVGNTAGRRCCWRRNISLCCTCAAVVIQVAGPPRRREWP
ncbi:hypothetical protein Acr_12g0010580 [Actinidia rufa]|uniref:Ankyrin repeat family protein n=1 Tax=Actinidia rufa TaxID=165716 RepID=A0A7J0FKT0_9ERIC|nr:hypothetical protein Acr_12g0010580 [Actinidia rufa]